MDAVDVEAILTPAGAAVRIEFATRAHPIKGSWNLRRELWHVAPRQPATVSARVVAISERCSVESSRK